MSEFQTNSLRMLWIQYRGFVILAAAAGLFISVGVFLNKSFINVPEGHLMVLVRKTGMDLKPGQVITEDPKQKGIQLKTYAEGWHFLNPYTWEAIIIPKLEIPPGKVGIRIRLYGNRLERGQVIAGKDAKGQPQKGILSGRLPPGRYSINTFAYKVELHDKITVPPGHLGVVIRTSGTRPKDPNLFLTLDGERGVQKATLSEGDHYINPYEKKVVSVDTRAHKFEMVGKQGITFPSKDGFKISMDGTIEWYIDRTRASEVFVKYVDNKSSVINNIVNKIILPYARGFSRIEGSKYLARDFIGGQTRQQFQEEFLHGMQKACGSQGIIIRSALVKNVVPPNGIVKPIMQREIAIRLREKYVQQMEREKQQKQLSIQKTLQSRAQKVNKAQADVAVSVTQAEQRKEVAIIEAKKKLQYAVLQLKAAQNEARILIAQGQAKAKVIRLKNKANAEGLRNSVRAFGSGEAFVQYLFYKKLARSFQSILSNTNGPFLEVFKDMSRTIHKNSKANQPAPAKQGGTR
ncbi:MAG: hypothetical protein EP343_27300 [Deltaproteobacteria bacterium]|nr:MAG: hypothetical protein EP343_27300 [Deltaproteobacteria bacterium]